MKFKTLLNFLTLGSKVRRDHEDESYGLQLFNELLLVVLLIDIKLIVYLKC